MTCIAIGSYEIYVILQGNFMALEFKTTCAICAYHYLSCEFQSHLWQGVLNLTLCDKVCQWLVAGQWVSLDTPVSTNKTDRHDKTEILLKIALHTNLNTNP
jgi:hypothetical protein